VERQIWFNWLWSYNNVELIWEGCCGCIGLVF